MNVQSRPFDAIHYHAQRPRCCANIYWAALRPAVVFLDVTSRSSSRSLRQLVVKRRNLQALLYNTVSTLHMGALSVVVGFDGEGVVHVWGRQLATSYAGGTPDSASTVGRD